MEESEGVKPPVRVFISQNYIIIVRKSEKKRVNFISPSFFSLRRLSCWHNEPPRPTPFRPKPLGFSSCTSTREAPGGGERERRNSGRIPFIMFSSSLQTIRAQRRQNNNSLRFLGFRRGKKKQTGEKRGTIPPQILLPIFKNSVLLHIIESSKY
jgi:hypothetical protein